MRRSDRIDAIISSITPDEKGCKIWPLRLKGDGYPEVWIDNRGYRANRYVLTLKLGREIKPGMFAIHECDNPACVAENHIHEGTPQQNVEDMIKRGRYVSNWPKG